MALKISPEKKQIFSLIGAGLVVLAIFIVIGVRTTSEQPSNFELNREGLSEFFAENINLVVPGEGWSVTQLRFAKEQGVYVEYKNDERTQAFLMLVNPTRDRRIDYEIIGVFNVAADGALELVSGIDSFAGEEQEIFRLNDTGGWEQAN